jgi:hypothetical protein
MFIPEHWSFHFTWPRPVAIHYRMGNLFFVGLFLTLTAASPAALAADSGSSIKGSSESGVASVEAEPAPARHLKVTATSYYYNMQGTTGARGDVYSFGATTVAMQLLTMSYDLGNGFTAAAIGEYIENYVETYMPIPKVGTFLFKDRTHGWGDTLLDVSHPIFMSSSVMLFGDLGVSLPTGSIEIKNPSSPVHGNYPYNMQMGSGTFDAEAGFVGLYLHPVFQLGTHLSTFQRIGEAKNDYRLGNLYKGEGWFDFPVGLGFTPRLVGFYKVKQAIHGVDPTLGRNIYTEYYFHDQQNWDISAALKFEHKLIGNAMIVAEAGKPLTQGSKNSDGVVVSTNYYGTLGVSGTF